MEMKKRRVLSEMQPFAEELVHAPSKGRPKIVDAIWTLYASAEFVDEIIGGNKQMKQAQRGVGAKEGGHFYQDSKKSQAGGNKRYSPLKTPEKPGEISVKVWPRKVGGNKR